MMISRMNRDKESAQYKSRTSRLAKWRELVAQAQKSLEVAVAVPEVIMHLSSMSQGPLYRDSVSTFQPEFSHLQPASVLLRCLDAPGLE